MAIPTRALRHLAIALVVIGAGTLLVGDQQQSVDGAKIVLVVSITALAGATGCAVALHRRARREQQARG